MPHLGKLESTVMDILWSSAGPLTVRDVLEKMPAQRVLAYTTVMTVLSNLHRKAMVDREPAGKAYSYRPALTRQGAAAAALRECLDRRRCTVRLVQTLDGLATPIRDRFTGAGEVLSDADVRVFG